MPGKEDAAQYTEFKNYNEYKRIFHKFCRGTPHDIMKRFVQYNTTEDIWRSYTIAIYMTFAIIPDTKIIA